MQISDFPEAIARTQFQLLSQEQHLRKLQDALSQFNAEIEGAVAFDKTLTNEGQRKAKKAELMAVEDYQALLLEVQSAQDKRTEQQIQLDLLRNQFSVLKLNERRAIAELEAVAAA
ncbi:hypothetical protein IQ268_09145 [Oculatella sp. LEGE 06141]|uniref:hypothetical protein n=1 Tax=Oculatella sp. LEGE 06141 TaxID=1828648 RepID=UPI00187F3163|nr:hypothetical protein [Oculatella sp. LEGE 06141]MBE9178725.1 hypothetical protein [Oculatella sp. LEGE 06141]